MSGKVIGRIQRPLCKCKPHNGPLNEATFTPEARRPAEEVAQSTQKKAVRVRGGL